jgi:hypothetical protein
VPAFISRLSIPPVFLGCCSPHPAGRMSPSSVRSEYLNRGSRNREQAQKGCKSTLAAQARARRDLVYGPGEAVH